MSYSRWSTLLPREKAADYYMEWFNGGPKLEDCSGLDQWTASRSEWVARFLRENGLECSAWYIFHDASSGDTLQEQALSVWYSGSIGGGRALPTLAYAELRAINDTEQWSKIPGYDDCSTLDQDNLERCVRQFLRDVETQYGIGNAGQSDAPE